MLQPGRTRFLAAAAIVFATPVLVATVMTELPRLIRPGDSMPVETPLDRLLVSLFTWGVIVALLSVPASVVSWAFAAYLVWRNGTNERWTRTAGAFAIAALLAAALLGWRMVEGRESAERWAPRNAHVNTVFEGAA